MKTRMQRRRMIANIISGGAAVLMLIAATTIVCARVEFLMNIEHEDSEEYLMYLESQKHIDYEALDEAVAEYAEAPYESERIEEAIYELPNKRYELTTEEFYWVCGVVAAEAENEPYDGKVAVAQTILNNCERTNSRPADVAWMYAEPRHTWSDEVWQAVTAVFHEGQTVTDELILWFYAPALCESKWHESQMFVMEIGGHRFFAEWEGK